MSFWFLPSVFYCSCFPNAEACVLPSLNYPWRCQGKCLPTFWNILFPSLTDFWFSSYLFDILPSFLMEHFKYGSWPQDSVLGPLLLILYPSLEKSFALPECHPAPCTRDVHTGIHGSAPPQASALVICRAPSCPQLHTSQRSNSACLCPKKKNLSSLGSYLFLFSFFPHSVYSEFRRSQIWLYQSRD